MTHAKKKLVLLLKKILIKIFPGLYNLFSSLRSTSYKLQDINEQILSCRIDILEILNYIDQKDPNFLMEMDKKNLPVIFKERLGYELNIDNPKTFNEKLQWLKVNYRKPEMTIMADKFRVRDYLKQKGYGQYLNELYGVYKDIEEVKAKWDNLPASFVLKVNHWSGGGNLLIKDKYAFDITQLGTLEHLLGQNFYYLNRWGEWPYKDIVPLIISEKYLEDETGGLMDYKVFCFNGKAIYIQIDIDRFNNHKRCFYNRNWVKQLFSNNYPLYEGEIAKPEKLTEMLIISEKLSSKYPHLRVDFYVIDNELVFGEFTFTHGSGFERFIPDKWDLILGEKLNLF